jgi:predicted O-linked N-acetylglucosamine transferase (SPINDLY family)
VSQLDRLRAAAQAEPGSGPRWDVLGVALAQSGLLAEAVKTLRRALMLAPDRPEIHNNYGNVLQRTGDLSGAMACYHAALKRRPDYAQAWANLGIALHESGDAQAAIGCFDTVLAAHPEDGASWSHRGVALAALGRLAEAEQSHRRAVQASPERADGYNNFAILLKDLGRLDEAREHYAKAMQYAPGDAAIHSNALMCLCYDETIEAPALVAAHRGWATRHAPARAAPDFSDYGDSGPLRIGYVSPDFRAHSVAYFLDSVFRRHDPARVSVHCYADVSAPDAMTARLRKSAAHWHDSYGMSDAALAEQIRADRIQVLVDLAGHTANNRLAVFGRRVAPVQVTWLGYGATTGLPQMDYRVTDARIDPPGAGDAWWTEQLYRLPGGSLCYAPPDDCPLAVAAEPGPVTFGSFNNYSKINPSVVALWARVLCAVDGSRLLLKARQLADVATGERLRRQFERQAIDPTRIEFAARTQSYDDHMACYGRVDVALDCFPYNGVTTTCEALWMGCPVVTLDGEWSIARYGTSLLHAADCAQWVAQDPDEFVKIAGGLAHSRISRADLRARIAGAALTDARIVAAGLEDAYHTMWRGWVGRAAP